MDNEMLSKIAASYGVPLTAKNANAIRQFGGSNPNALEHRAMGMRGSAIDDNTDLLALQLEKFIQEADGKPAITQEQLPPLDTVQNASQPTRRTAKAAPVQTQAAPYNAEQNLGPTPPANATSFDNRQAGTGGFGLDDFLFALLGLSSAAGRSAMSRSGNKPTPQLPAPSSMEQKLLTYAGNDPRNPTKQLTYPPKLEDGGAQQRADDANKTKTVSSDPALTEEAKRRQLQAEIDSENADAKRLQDQIMERNKNQNATRDLLKSAKRTVTGR